MNSVDGLVLIFFGVAIGLLSTQFLSKGIAKKISSRVRLVKTYWRFLIPFLLLVFISYIGVFKFLPREFWEFGLDMIGQISALIFAVFVGWYAFIQVIEGRVEKWKQQAHQYFIEGSYTRARDLYEKSFAIDPDDFTNTAELMELYIVTDNERDFDTNLPALFSSAVEDDEKVVLHYLKITKHLLREDLGAARANIADCVKFVQENPGYHQKFTWGFDDLQKSGRYKSLEGDAKNMLDNTCDYVKKNMSDEVRTRFESGNYTQRD